MVPLPPIHNARRNTSPRTLLPILRDPQIISLRDRPTTIRDALPETKRAVSLCRVQHQALNEDVDAGSGCDVAFGDFGAAAGEGGALVVI